MRWMLVWLACGMAAPARAQEVGDPASADGFAGQWEAASDDGTELHGAELAASGVRVSGRVIRAERGYFSGKVTVEEQLDLVGTVEDGVLRFDGTLAEADGRQAAVSGTAIRRGSYLIVRVGTYEVALAPPGVPLEAGAEGSAAAAALAKAIAGREYSAGTQAQGGGAFVGSRVRLALCADGTVTYSRSDLAATPGALPGEGVDAGSSWSRRGRWRIVVYAGLPAVRADWEGTGSSYSLVRYIRVVPDPDGRSAVVDGDRLPVTGRC